MFFRRKVKKYLLIPTAFDLSTTNNKGKHTMAKTITLTDNNNQSVSITIEDNEYSTLRDMLNSKDVRDLCLYDGDAPVADLLYKRDGTELSSRQARQLLEASPGDGDTLGIDAEFHMNDEQGTADGTAGCVTVVMPPQQLSGLLITPDSDTVAKLITRADVMHHFAVLSKATIQNMAITISRLNSDGSQSPDMEVPKNMQEETTLRAGDIITIVQSKSATGY